MGARWPLVSKDIGLSFFHGDRRGRIGAPHDIRLLGDNRTIVGFGSVRMASPLRSLQPVLTHPSAHPLFRGAQPGKTQFSPHLAVAFPIKRRIGQHATDTIEPVNGFLRVPEGPGLGVSLDRNELERLENLNLPRPDKWIIKSRFGNGSRMYNIADPDNSIFMVRPDIRRLIPMSYVVPIATE